MGNTSGAVLQAGINRAIQSASTYLNPDTRDAILGPALSRYAKGGSGKTLMELACHADGLRVVFDTLLADGKITNSEIEVCKDYLALTAAHFAKVRTQYAGFATLVGSDIGPFLKLYRDDTGAFGYRDSSTKWSGIQACMNIGKNHGDGTALNILRDTLLQAAKTLLMADGVEDKELDYLKKLSAEIGSNSTSGATKPGSSQSATPLQKVIDADFECWEKSSNTEDWLDENISNLKFWQQAAQGKDPKAQVILGLCHQYGKGVEEDKEEAVRWYRLAADQGQGGAQCCLGVCCAHGEGVEKDKEEAVRWFRLAADQGQGGAQNNLGICYAKGEGVEKDMEEAVRWFRLAADQGYADAQINLGLCYAKGEGVEEDMEEAVRWFRLAAEQGDAQAQNNLGICYVNGKGVEEDKEEAVRWYRLAADQGLADAQYNLGRRYDDGDGVEEDKEEAVRWYRLAADQGHGGAQCCLGVCCANGEGVEKDMEEAVRWFRLAADQEHAPGQYFLGISYFYGNGVKENKEEGTKWIQMAADGGWSKAQEFLDNATEDEDEYEDDEDQDQDEELDEVEDKDEDEEFEDSEDDDKAEGKYNSILQKIENGKHLDKTDVRCFKEYLHLCNDGEDAYVELEIKVLTDQVAELISEWSPVCNCGAVINIDIKSISDTAASHISKWSSHDGTVYELQLTKLKDISIPGAKSLLNSNLHLRININNFSESVRKIFLLREIAEDFGEGRLLLNPLNEGSGSEEYDEDEDEDEYEDDDSGNADSQLWPVHSVRFSERELVDPPGTVINSLGMKFVPIKPGKFMMGGREDEEGYNEEEELLHAVQITKPFLLGMFAVTQSDYVKVMGSNPSIFHGKTRPVEHVTWKQAVDFCKRLSELPAEKAAKRVYRLPTEAEWEYACRAGTETAFAFGDELTQLQANFCQENVSVPQPTLPVGMYPPNAWGLFDMHGNVWEWCSDWYGLDYYSTSPAMDPKGPAKGTHHVLRGGSASVMGYECRSAIRGEARHDGPFPNGSARFEFIGDFGFRVVCEFRQ